MSINRRSVRFRNKKTKIQTLDIKIISIILLIIIFICSVVLIIKNIQNKKYISEKQNEVNQYISKIFEDKKIEEQSNIKYAKLTFVGDILGKNSIYESVYNKNSNTYNFSTIFDEVKKYTQKNDLCIGSLETNFTTEAYSGSGKYNTPTSLGDSLKEIGVSLLNVANNHSLDYGSSGVINTKDFLDTIGIQSVGTNRGEEQRFIVKEVNGINIAFLSYTYGVNETDGDVNKYINIIDKEKIKEDIQKAKQQSEYICINMHWGNVDSKEVTDEQKELADFLVENGANIILGTHPSVIQPVEIRKNQENEDVLIVYSMGNFLSDTSNMGIILDVKLIKNNQNNKVSLGKVEYTPIYLLDKGNKTQDRYKIIDVKNSLKKYSNGDTEELNKRTYKKLADEFIKVGKLLESE